MHRSQPQLKTLRHDKDPKQVTGEPHWEESPPIFANSRRIGTYRKKRHRYAQERQKGCTLVGDFELGP